MDILLVLFHQFFCFYFSFKFELQIMIGSNKSLLMERCPVGNLMNRAAG